MYSFINSIIPSWLVLYTCFLFPSGHNAGPSPVCYSYRRPSKQMIMGVFLSCVRVLYIRLSWWYSSCPLCHELPLGDK